MSNFVETLKSYLPASWTSSGPIVPVLRFSGAIGVVTPLRPGLSLATSAAAIEKAFAMSGAKAVAIQINSPGGSAVQSMLIYKRIRALAAEKDLKVYVFAEDVAASGGYLLACAGDEIYADPSSIVGSIGVITATFGVSELINRSASQRRVYTAGENKDTLDPFFPEKPADVERIKALQPTCTRHSSISSSRGAAPRSKRPTSNLFTGEFWSGKKAVEFGLIDGLADLRGKMREVYGERRAPQAGNAERLWFRRRRGIAVSGGLRFGLHSWPRRRSHFGWSNRALWSRFGL